VLWGFIHQEMTRRQYPTILLLDTFDPPDRKAAFLWPILVKLRLSEKDVPATISND